MFARDVVPMLVANGIINKVSQEYTESSSPQEIFAPWRLNFIVGGGCNQRQGKDYLVNLIEALLKKRNPCRRLSAEEMAKHP
jgi:hypothetical protein